MEEKIDPSTIEDESVCQLVIHLMNVVETLSGQVSELTAENQRLRDENNRLKGEQGKPRILPNKPTTDLSSEKERRQSKPRNMRSKRDPIQIDRVKDLKVDKTLLPPDAVFKGHEQIVIQDVKFQTDNVCFRREKYYSRASNAPI